MNISRFTKSEIIGKTISPVLFGRKLNLKVKKNKTLQKKFNQYQKLVNKIMKKGTELDKAVSQEVKKMYPMSPWVSLAEVSKLYQVNFKLRQEDINLKNMFNRKRELEAEINWLVVLAAKDQKLIKVMKSLKQRISRH